MCVYVCVCVWVGEPKQNKKTSPGGQTKQKQNKNKTKEKQKNNLTTKSIVTAYKTEAGSDGEMYFYLQYRTWVQQTLVEM